MFYDEKRNCYHMTETEWDAERLRRWRQEHRGWVVSVWVGDELLIKDELSIPFIGPEQFETWVYVRYETGNPFNGSTMGCPWRPPAWLIATV